MSSGLDPITLEALAAFPGQLEAHYRAVPSGFARWRPPTWEGIPSEAFTALEQVCHVRDIEVDGYHRRFHRILHESHPFLEGVDGFRLAEERDYAGASGEEALAAFRAARAQTVSLLRSLASEQLQRTAEFEDYGSLSTRGLAHYLCSHDQQHLAGLQWLLGKIDAARLS